MVTSKCPVSNCVGFCWKNVWHWVVLLALLPFALRGVGAVANIVSGGSFAMHPQGDKSPK